MVTVLSGSDGGDGLLVALREAGLLRRETSHACEDGLGDERTVSVGWLESGAAVIESRLVIGLSLVPPSRRDPSRTRTRGLGALIDSVAAMDPPSVFVGLGGSATMDGGIGMASAWGWTFLDRTGASLPPMGCSLSEIHGVVPGRPPAVPLVGVVDVWNRLLGADGARVYAPQKGADPAMAADLDRGLASLVRVMGKPGADAAARPGAGAAGGLGFGLMAFGAATLQGGADWFLDRVGFENHLAVADVVMTAEGAFDATSSAGKLPGEVMRRARNAGRPAVLLAPTVQDAPPDVLVEQGGGDWSLADVERHARSALQRIVSLPPH